jgi:branched-chain amino acid transport system substrate-binding protein
MTVYDTAVHLPPGDGRPGRAVPEAQPGHLRRRKILVGAAATAVAPLTAPFIARAADPIRIGLLLAKTGQIAAQTEYLANGSFLAMHERDNQILGQPAELVWLDEPTPQAATQNMHKLVQENKVIAVLGGSLSSNALAEEAIAPHLNIPFVCNNAAATDITGKNCNRFTFRLNTPVAVQCRMLTPFVLNYGKRWYHITASYAFGQDILRSSRQLLKAAGGTEVGSDEVPLNTADFSSFILKIRQAKPDVVVGGLSAGDLSTFLKQWNELGMKGTIPFAEIAIGDTDIWAVGPNAATGTFTKMWYYNNPDNPPEEKAFAGTYLRKYGRPPADKAWMGWITARSLFEAINAAKSTDPMAIVEALEAWKVQAGQTTYSYRRFDHQMMVRNLAVSVKDHISDRWDYFDVKATLPENPADLDKIFGTPEETGCKMT